MTLPNPPQRERTWVLGAARMLPYFIALTQAARHIPYNLMLDSYPILRMPFSLSQYVWFLVYLKMM